MTLSVDMLGVFSVLMERRLEDYVLEKVSFQVDAPRFFELLTPRQFAVVLLAADEMEQIEIAAALGVIQQTINKHIKRARSRAVRVFGEEALAGRSNPRKKCRREEEER